MLYWIGNAFAFWAFYTFIPLYLVKVRQISTPVELTWLATYQVWAVAITYLGAWLSDRWGRRPFAILFAALTLVSVWGLTLVPAGLPLYLAGALLFGFNGATWTISFAHSTELYPTHIRGSGIGTTMACGRVVSILAPLFFGAVAARYGIAVAFRLGALAWLLTIIGYLLSRETSGTLRGRRTGALIPPRGITLRAAYACGAWPIEVYIGRSPSTVTRCISRRRPW